MNIAITVSGSHGDVRPMVAIAAELKRDGHSVTLIASPGNAELATASGLEVTASGRDWRSFLGGALGSTRNVLAMAGMMKAFLREEVRAQFLETGQLIGRPDVVVGAGFHFAARSIAESLGIPYCHVVHAPQFVRSHFHPPPSAPVFGLPTWVNRLWWRAHCAAYNGFLKSLINARRRRLGLRSIGDVWQYLTRSLIVASDRALAELPPDTRAAHVQTGYPHLDDREPLDRALVDFLEAGSPPIYVGFGSAPHFAGSDAGTVLKDLAAMCGVRVIAFRGWGGLRVASPIPGVLEIPRAPHAVLFPRLAGAVHHGGAGTTHTAAASGIPQLVVGFAMDQYYWGHRVHVLGLGPAPLSILTIRRAQLVRRVAEMVGRPEYRRNAAEIAAQMRTTVGTRATCAHIVGTAARATG